MGGWKKLPTVGVGGRMTHLIAYVDACMEIADARSEVKASRLAAKSVEGSALYTTMNAMALDAERRLFVAENEGAIKRDALLGKGGV